MFSKIVYVLIPTMLISGGILVLKHHKTPEGIQSMKYMTENLSLISTSMQANLAAKKKVSLYQVVDPAELTESSTTKSEGETVKPANTSQINFCGEIVPLEMGNVAAKFEAEIQRNKQSKGSVLYALQIGNRYKKQIVQTLEANGLPADFYYLAVAESGLNNLTSPRGAKGFWQFMEDAATRSGLEVSATVDERFHPEKATLAACKYLKTMNKMFHNWTSSAAAYNMGAGGLMGAMNNQGKKDYYQLDLNSETAHYVYRILALKYVMEQPDKYGMKANVKNKFTPIPYYIVKVDSNIPDLAAFAKEYNSNLRALKLMNPWLISDKLTVKAGKTYEIRFPKTDKINAEELIALPSHNAANRKELRESILRDYSNAETKEPKEKEVKYTF